MTKDAAQRSIRTFYRENRFPPFGKGGPGGISDELLKNPPRSPFSKGGSNIGGGESIFSYSGVNARRIHDSLRCRQYCFSPHPAVSSYKTALPLPSPETAGSSPIRLRSGQGSRPQAEPQPLPRQRRRPGSYRCSLTEYR